MDVQVASAEFGRRALLAGAGGLALSAVVPASANAGADAPALGMWLDSPQGLPAYRYTGPLTFASSPMLPDDPWFMLGNQRMTLFVHVSGRLRLLSGARGWAGLNGADGLNRATLVLNGTAHVLVGLHAPAAVAGGRLFSPGNAEFTYVLPGLDVTRALGVAPSIHVGDGVSAVLVTLILRNTGATPCSIAYEEGLTGEYRPLWSAGNDHAQRVRHDSVTHLQADRAVVETRAAEVEPLALPPRPAVSEFDAEPPTLWVAPLSVAELHSTAHDRDIGVAGTFTLLPGETRTLRFAFGFAWAHVDIDAALARFAAAPSGPAPFAADWLAILPTLAEEQDAQTRREMRWNAAALEAMATWREYYGETVIPQGTNYDYVWGFTGWTRDVAQHALPLCRTNPALARSVLRYILKRTAPDGEIKLGDAGFGWVPAGSWATSDQQLYTFLFAAEYLRATGDARWLEDRLAWHPARDSAQASGLAHLTHAFLFLRDRIGTGAHGLVRLWNSDWNDLFYFWPKPIPYAELFETGESHANTALAIVALGDLSRELARLSPSARPLAEAMDAYRAKLLDAYLHDLSERDFPRRAYLGRAGAVGEDDMWLEPVGFTLLIPELPEASRRRLSEAFATRLLAGEKLGPRQIERSEPQSGLAPGSRENGGVWWSLAGPVVLGLLGREPARAQALFARMGFARYAVVHPDYWTGAWSASDSLDASRLPTAGLSSMQPWCAHAHAWPLYAYLRSRAA